MAYKEDMRRCLDDWYSRGSNRDLEGNLFSKNYRRMPMKPWATREWVDQRDLKLYELMKDHFSQKGVYLLPHSPKFHILHDYDEVRRGKRFREKCKQIIDNLSDE